MPERMTAEEYVARLCPDCGVSPGERHLDGCDVARCKHCGFQWLGCGHDDGYDTLWTGEWPGEAECRELGLFVTQTSVLHPPTVTCGPENPDRTGNLNELIIMAARGQLRWDSEAERWVKP